MAAVASSKRWNCTRCTFEQSALNAECEICGEPNKSIKSEDNIGKENKLVPHNNDKKECATYGCIIYQVDRFTDDQLTATYTLYLQNDSIQTSNWPIYLFGDNDIDNSRPPNTDREMIGGLAGVAGKFDRNIAFGIVTTFYAYKPMPDFVKFRDIINNQFNTLWNKYIIHGHDVIVPAPNDIDLEKHHYSFFEQMNNNDDNPQYQQVIFHNIGTGIARLPLTYLKYIQYKIDNLAKLSHQHNEGKPVVHPIPKAIEQPAPKKMEAAPAQQAAAQDPTMDFCPNDLIEVCVNPEVDVWVDAIFLGYSDTAKSKGYVEVVKPGKDSSFLDVFVKYIRFQGNDADEKDDEKKMDVDDNGNNAGNRNKNRLVQTDEWENVSDFVLKEYIHDVFDELSSNLLSSLDEFMRRMEFLGVYSAKSRSRALSILEEMKNTLESKRLAEKLEAEQKREDDRYKQQVVAKNDELIAAEMAQRLADGHTLESFKCIRCQQQQEHGGIELRNCSHKICYKCFPELISSHIAMKMLPTCLKCGSQIHETDIKVHVNSHTAEIVGDMHMKDMMSKQKDLHRCFKASCDGCIIIEDKYMKEFKCPVCNNRNCLKCKKIHYGNEQCYVPPPPKPVIPYYNHNANKLIPSYNTGNYHITNEEFINNWVNVYDIKTSNIVQAFDVPYHSDEWNKVIKHIRDPHKRKVERIQRIQNASVWRAYWAYCTSQRKKGRSQVKVGGFWHGTRTHKPEVIWKNQGFLKEKSRIGNCLWYATENTYSMGGFEHNSDHGKKQVFLAFVCCGNTHDVKFIRNDQILNVYKNAATYPAYLLTYKNT